MKAMLSAAKPPSAAKSMSRTAPPWKKAARQIDSNPASGEYPSGTLERSLGYQLRMAQLRIYQLFAALMTEFEIRPAQFALLVLLFECPGITQTEAGNTLNIEKANLTGLLLELRERNLMERKGVAGDKRTYTLHLTSRGAKLTRKLIERHEEFEEALAGIVGAGKKDHLLAMLRKLRNAEK